MFHLFVLQEEKEKEEESAKAEKKSAEKKKEPSGSKSNSSSKVTSSGNRRGQSLPKDTVSVKIVIMYQLLLEKAAMESGKKFDLKSQLFKFKCECSLLLKSFCQVHTIKILNLIKYLNGAQRLTELSLRGAFSEQTLSIRLVSIIL